MGVKYFKLENICKKLELIKNFRSANRLEKLCLDDDEKIGIMGKKILSRKMYAKNSTRKTNGAVWNSR